MLGWGFKITVGEGTGHWPALLHGTLFRRPFFISDRTLFDVTERMPGRIFSAHKAEPKTTAIGGDDLCFV